MPAWFEKIRTVAESDLTTSERIVLIMLARYENKKTHICWPSVRAISSDTGLKPTAVKQAIKSLRKKGAVSTTRRRRPDGSLSTLEFTLQWDRVPETVNVPGQEALNGSRPETVNVPLNLSIKKNKLDIEPFAAAWLLRYSGDPDVTIRRAMRRKFAKVVETHGMETALNHWHNFLASKDVDFASIGLIATFVSTFGKWDRVSTRVARR